MSEHHLKLGDVVEANEGTLARYCGDTRGSVVEIDGAIIRVRMKQSGRTVPFRREQLTHLALRSVHD